jgi:hypothetical protein
MIEGWHMKESKWIVYREFESEMEAKEAMEYMDLTKLLWKIKEV